MKIVNVEIIPISIPFEAPIISRAFTSSWTQTAEASDGIMGNVYAGAIDSALRCIVKVHTDSGLFGLGETRGSRAVQTILSSLSKELVGLNPFDIEKLLERLYWTPYFTGYDGYAAIAAVEMACWDLMGKATKQPLYNLLGGLYRELVPTNCYLFFRSLAEDGTGGEMESEALADFALRNKEKYGFKTFKFKAGIQSPRSDLETVARLRDKLGPDVNIVVDPNAAWGFSEAIHMVRELEKYNLFYLEDPCHGMEAMSRLRRYTNVPFSTNMCVIDMSSLSIALRMSPMPVDIVLFDKHKWGGMMVTKKLAGACEAVNIDIAHHSSPNAGISDAAMLHLAASTPRINMPLDCLQNHLMDDIVTKRFTYEQGAIRVPRGVGLGVELDEDKLQRYAERYQKVVMS